jgi:hypothetical protein
MQGSPESARFPPAPSCADRPTSFCQKPQSPDRPQQRAPLPGPPGAWSPGLAVIPPHRRVRATPPGPGSGDTLHPRGPASYGTARTQTQLGRRTRPCGGRRCSRRDRGRRCGAAPISTATITPTPGESEHSRVKHTVLSIQGGDPLRAAPGVHAHTHKNGHTHTVLKNT